MVDELYDRNFQAARAELNAALLAIGRKLRRGIAPSLRAIHRFEWDAPWNGKRGHRAKA